MSRVITRQAAGVLLAGLLLVGPTGVQAQQNVQPDRMDFTSSFDFTKGKSHFPSFVAPYTPRFVPPPNFSNSLRFEDLIRDGKLYLSLQDAIYLALENNLTIANARFGPAFAQTDVLRSRGGGVARGAGGLGGASSLGGGPTNLDPTISSSLSITHAQRPVSNPLESGTGTTLDFASLSTNTTSGSVTYSQGFVTGTGFSIGWNASRGTTSSLFSLFNPAVDNSVSIGVSQALLNGFGFAQNMRFIRVARNNLESSNHAFARSVMDSVSQVNQAYWDLIFAREDVKVKEQSLALAEKLYEDNKRQVEIGTLAPIEVVRAEAEVARTNQDLIVSRALLDQQQIAMKNLLTRNPSDPLLQLVEIVPTDTPQVPDVPEVLPVQDAIQIAMERRPQLAELQLTQKNNQLEVRAARDSMLPRLSAFAQWVGRGLSGIALDQPDPITGQRDVILTRGLGTAFTQSIQGDFPTYTFGFNFTIPLRNRQAQADMIQAQLRQRQTEIQYRQLVNNIIVDVQNAQINLEQNRARIEAARKSRELFQETLDAEQKKFQLGASTIFQVIQAQRDLAQARSQEVRALTDYQKAVDRFDRALGRTLERNNVVLDDAKTGIITAGRPINSTGSVN